MNNKVDLQKKRDKSYDLLKLLAMYLVLLGHCVEHFVPEYGLCTNKPIFTYIYSIHMPLFAAISGFFAYNSIAKSSFRDSFSLIKKKFSQLIMPCLTMGVILIITEILLGKNSDSFKDIIQRYISCFWFLKALFACFILSICTTKLKRYSTILSIGFVIASVLLLTKFSLVFLFPSFLFGMFLRKKEKNWTTHLAIMSIGSCFLFVILLIFWKQPFYPFVSINLLLSGNLSKVLDISLLQLYRLLTGFTGSFFFITLFKILFAKKSNKIVCLLGSMGEKTLGIYIFQCILVEDLMPIFFKLPNNSFLLQLNLFPIALGLLYLLAKLVEFIEKNRFLSFFVLGKKT